MVENQHREFLITHVVNAAIKAGAAIMEIYNTPDSYDVSVKSDNTPITAADRAAHNTIKQVLGATRIPILSEEGREMRYEERCNWELFWLVDPLDGTHEFIERTDEFTINIALMSNNQCVGAAIYVPCHQKLYLAARGKGAYLCCGIAPSSDAAYNYQDILEVSQQLPLLTEPRSVPIVAISRLHNTPETFEHIESIKREHPSLEVVEQGSSYKFCMLAEGVADYYVRTSTTYEWDTAAGELILREAGGEMSALPSGEKFAYNKEQLENPWFTACSSISAIEL